MEKFELFNELYLLYSDFLNENNREIFDLYYGENLSMQEIAEIKMVSRSRIGAIIKNNENKLLDLESKCGLYKYKNELRELLKENDLLVIKDHIERILNDKD